MGLKLNLTDSLKAAERALSKNSPQILAGVGIAGMVSAIIFAVKATPKAVEAIDKEKGEAPSREMQNVAKRVIDGEFGNGTERVKALTDKGYDYDTVQNAVNYLTKGNTLPVKDTIRVTWKYYIPTAVTAIGSAACIIASNSIHTKRNAAIAAAYTLSETALKEYKDAAVEVVGPKKEQTIQDKVSEKHVDNLMLDERTVYPTGRGDTLCLDVPSNTPFYSDIEDIRRAVNTINMRLRSEMELSLNDFYSEIGIPGCSNGDLLGWDIDKGEFTVSYYSKLVNNSKPCLAIDYAVYPQEHYVF